MDWTLFYIPWFRLGGAGNNKLYIIQFITLTKQKLFVRLALRTWPPLCWTRFVTTATNIFINTCNYGPYYSTWYVHICCVQDAHYDSYTILHDGKYFCAPLLCYHLHIEAHARDQLQVQASSYTIAGLVFMYHPIHAHPSCSLSNTTCMFKRKSVGWCQKCT